MKRWIKVVACGALALAGLTGLSSPAHAAAPGNDDVGTPTILTDNTPLTEDTTEATLSAAEASLAGPYLGTGLTNAVWFSYTASSQWAKVTSTGPQSTAFVVEDRNGVVSWGAAPTWFATPGTTYQIAAYATGAAGQLAVTVDPSDPTPVATQAITAVTASTITGSYSCTGYVNGYSTFYLHQTEGGTVIGAAPLGGLTCDGQIHQLALPVTWTVSSPPSQVWITDGLESCVNWGPGPHSTICTSANRIDGLYDVAGGSTTPPPPPPPPAVAVDDATVSLGRDGRLTATVTYVCGGAVTSSSTQVDVKELAHGSVGDDIASLAQDVSLTCDNQRRQVALVLDPVLKVHANQVVDVGAALHVQASGGAHADGTLEHQVKVDAARH